MKKEIKLSPSTSGHYLRAALFIVAAILLAASVWYFRRDYISSDSYTPPRADVEPVPEDKSIAIEPSATTSEEEGLSFYLRLNQGDASAVTKVTYDLKTKPKNVRPLPYTFHIGQQFAPGNYLVTNEDKGAISVYEPASNTVKEVFALDKREGIDLGQGVLSHDGHFIAYTVNIADSSIGLPARGEVWEYNINTREHTLITSIEPLKLYSGVSIIGWSEGDQQILFEQIGGDAGAVWGSVYSIQSHTSGQYQELHPDKSSDNFLFAKISPSGRFLAYNYCENEETVDNEFASCPDGQQLVLYEIANGKTSTLFQVSEHGNNVYKGILRNILSYQWLDDKLIVITTVDGVYTLNIATKARVRTYSFPRNLVNDVVTAKNTYSVPTVYPLTSNYYLLNSPSVGSYILNTQTGTSLLLSSPADSYGAYTELGSSF